MPTTSLAAATGALLLIPLLAPLAASPASAQADRMARPPVAARPGELAFFSETNFRGRSYFVTGPRENLTVPFRPRSMQVARGDAWTLCARTAFRAPCVEVRESNPNAGPLINVVNSARLARGGEFSGTGPAGPTLIGMASEFFRAPQDRGRRVAACPGRPAAAACAADTARRFCLSRGYRSSGHQLIETVGREDFLADVLCRRAN